MDFNFNELYRDYSSIDLLKIIKRPSDYQPTAVEAAKKILGSRVVTQSEIEAAGQYFIDLENKTKAKTGKVDEYRDKAAGLLEPIVNPGTEINPVKWLNILLLVIGLQYAWTFYESIRDFIFLLNCSYCGFDLAYLLTAVNLVYIPFIFYLLLKRKRWGWILLFGDNLLALILKLIQLFMFFGDGWFGVDAPGIFLFIICLKFLFVIFLWREDIAALFNITSAAKKQTVIIVVLIGLIYTLVLLLPWFYS